MCMCMYEMGVFKSWDWLVPIYWILQTALRWGLPTQLLFLWNSEAKIASLRSRWVQLILLYLLLFLNIILHFINFVKNSFLHIANHIQVGDGKLSSLYKEHSQRRCIPDYSTPRQLKNGPSASKSSELYQAWRNSKNNKQKRLTASALTESQYDVSSKGERTEYRNKQFDIKESSLLDRILRKYSEPKWTGLLTTWLMMVQRIG